MKFKEDEYVSVILKDGKVFKRCKSKKKRFINELHDEFKNYSKIKNIKGKIQFSKVIRFSSKKYELVLKYIDGTNLRKKLDENLFFEFGKALKKLHEKGITHGHLEVQDVIVKGNLFYVVDLPYLNLYPPLKDYARFKISLMLYQLKNPLFWGKYNSCMNAFHKGYSPNVKLGQKYINREVSDIIRCYNQRGIKEKFKSLMILLFIKTRI